VALIGVGKENDHGHPAWSALTMLRDCGVTVFRTDRSGQVSVTTAGNGGLSVAVNVA
jgi:beta-lactamase superfamily II metal-dependent hydrolase